MEQIALGLREAAASVGLSHWTLRAWLRRGKLRSVRLGRRVLIEPGELRKMVEQGRSADNAIYDLRKLGGEASQ